MPLTMNQVDNQFAEIFGGPVDVIHQYTRAEAIEDGVLIDVTNVAEEAGFKYPVAMTANVWYECIEPSEHCRNLGQTERGRLFDLFTMLHFAIKAKQGPADLILFNVKFGRQVYALKSLCHGGDNAEPVITIMFIGED